MGLRRTGATRRARCAETPEVDVSVAVLSRSDVARRLRSPAPRRAGRPRRRASTAPRVVRQRRTVRVRPAGWPCPARCVDSGRSRRCPRRPAHGRAGRPLRRSTSTAGMPICVPGHRRRPGRATLPAGRPTSPTDRQQRWPGEGRRRRPGRGRARRLHRAAALVGRVLDELEIRQVPVMLGSGRRSSTCCSTHELASPDCRRPRGQRDIRYRVRCCRSVLDLADAAPGGDASRRPRRSGP